MVSSVKWRLLICMFLTKYVDIEGNTTSKSLGHATPLFNVTNSEPSGNNATLEPSYMITSILPSRIVTALKPSVRKRTSILSRDIEISSERMTVNLKLSGQFTTQKSSDIATSKSLGHTTIVIYETTSKPSSNMATPEPSYMITSILSAGIVTTLKPSIRNTTSILSRDIEPASESMIIPTPGFTTNMNTITMSTTTSQPAVNIPTAKPTPYGYLHVLYIKSTFNATTSELTLRCGVQGYPLPNVWWTKDGSFLNGTNISFKNDKTLVVMDPQPRDNGTYYCHARNILTYVNRSLTLNLIFLPRILYIAKGPIQLHSWQRYLRIGCLATGYPDLRVNWKRNGTEIMDNSTVSRVFQVRDTFGIQLAVSWLYFKEVQCRDAGNYTCESFLSGHNYIQRAHIELICSSNFNLSSEVSSPSLSINIFPTATSILDSSSFMFKLSPSKSISPTAARSVAITTSIIAIWVPENLSVKPRNPVVAEHTFIVLSCNCECSNQPRWFKNNQLIHYYGPASLYMLFANGSLLINASRYATGNYSCEIRTPFWTLRSPHIKLDVQYLDDGNVTGDWDIYEGQNISLICHGSGNPYPKYTWYLDGQQMKINPRTTMQENHLSIFNATTGEGGQYKCLASNTVGKVENRIVVIVRDISSIGISMNTSSYIEVGTQIRFRCYRKKGFNHMLKLELVKDKISFYNWGWLSFWDYRYTPMYHVSQNYTGSYRCKGTVGAATRYSSPIDLSVGIPSGPVILEKDSETSTTGIRLSWKPISKEFWNGEQVTFQIHVSAVDDTWQKSYAVKTTSVIISGLLPSTAYIVSITGKTVFGPFQNTTKIVLTTEKNKNSKKYQLRIRLTNYEFSSKLLDTTSRQYQSLKTKLEDSLNSIYTESAIEFNYIRSSVSRFEKGSVVASIVINLNRRFVDHPSILAHILNSVDTLDGYRFEKSYTNVKDFDECEAVDLNTCHKYAHCENVPGTYICKCFEGFFGDGEECEGPPRIVSKSPVNITQEVETNVTLVCTIIADPDPVITWKRADADGNFVEISVTSGIYDGNYTIFNARIEDSGIYLCNASNKLGYDSYRTEVVIKPVRVDIDVEISLSNKTFKEELKNESSPAFKELAQDVYVELYNFFNNTPGFKDIEVLGFAKGSVKVIFRVIIEVLKPSKESNDVVAVKVGQKISKQLLTGSIGSIMVVPKAIKLRVPPPPPANVTYSDVEETKVHVSWGPPQLHEMFSIQGYYITYRKYEEKEWTNDTINANKNQITNFKVSDLESDTFYILRIFAWNAYGLGKESDKMEIKTKKVEVVSPWYYIGPIIAVASVVLLVAIMCLVKRVLQSGAWKVVGNQRSNLNEKEGKMSFQMLKSKKQINKSSFENAAFFDTPSSSGWTEILRSSIEISDKTLIPGEYGTIVAQGTHAYAKKKETCSIKMLKEHATADEFCDLMNELKTISSITFHENIVNLIGACTRDEGPVIVLLEFCSRGTLENNLREKEKKELLLRKKTKIRLETEIAKGMSHLAEALIVHPDLTSKNILITEDFTPKISNFGLPRDIYERSSYQKLIEASLPSRWMAIESRTDGLFTTESNVWSFAVVMWEIESGGCIPYREFKITDLVDKINAGYRLPKPEQASKEIYKLMLNCWNENPDLRPTFHEIVDITN